jgi:hypothetical protein
MRKDLNQSAINPHPALFAHSQAIVVSSTRNLNVLIQRSKQAVLWLSIEYEPTIY